MNGPRCRERRVNAVTSAMIMPKKNEIIANGIVYLNPAANSCGKDVLIISHISRYSPSSVINLIFQVLAASQQ